MFTSLKAGERAIYLDYVVLAQILPGNVCPPNINDDYIYADNEVPLLVPLYNTGNRYFKGLRKWLGYITIRGNQDEQFHGNFPQDPDLTELEPKNLDYSVQVIRREARECILNFMKHAPGLSNNNLIKNANALMQSKDAKIGKKDFTWINNSLSQTESKFKLLAINFREFQELRRC